ATYGQAVWLRAATVAEVSPEASAAFCSSAPRTEAPSRAAATVPAPDRASSAATPRRPAQRTANAATRAARPTTDRAAGTPVTSLRRAVRGKAPPATVAVPSDHCCRVASRATAAPAAPLSRARARLRRPAREGPAASERG